MKIVFHSNQISERGTETAIIDYAFANEKYLGNESIIAFPADRILNKERYLFIKENFRIITYTVVQEFHDILIQERIDLIYVIVDGESYPDLIDELPFKKTYKTFVHAVFSTKRKHGDYYCPIHSFLNKFYHTRYPVLPHIVAPWSNVEGDLRGELKIPKTAKVFGSYGGKNSFNIPFVQECIINIAEKNTDIYFIFLNIQRFVEKDVSNIIFLPGTTNLKTKELFVNTVDAMIHARSDGETFGLAVGEFSIKNKPIITFLPGIKSRFKEFIRSWFGKRPSYCMAHVENLGGKAFYYQDKKTLSDILLYQSFEGGDFDCFSERFAPQNVIEIFNQIICKD